ncbi:GH1 family beta-glucosidase [Catalinimonas niigatensis]|uniref:GH1 family beta-glucosidase n=1 Tax=Catalinimonas niigatensis TaxID=1397264 RepID=UPI0026666371|nr:GH1 family beta-glucosidase [Catalinimonas niigatensis]WPP51497.1 GH1 family beta-glucosidase [Catalinimonas niigatensis]
MQAKDFGDSFHWGVSSAAYQTEGAHNLDGKGLSIWDDFVRQKGKVYQNQHANVSCDFYHRYPEDIAILKTLGIKHFRFSISWSRIFPAGIGKVNQKGLDFYKKVIETCLAHDITPWITLYHWDLPLALSKRGGWMNRDIIRWFGEYVDLCSRKLGDRVKYWMVLNEPLVFTGAGYFLGIHAPGKQGLLPFLSTVHHAAMCQAEGGRILKSNCPDAEIGTTFSCTLVEPHQAVQRDIEASKRTDALLNRLFIEPSLGLGYPVDYFHALRRIEKYMRADDEVALKFDFDFIGLQNYTREIIRHSCFTPYIHARPVGAEQRNVPTNLMKWEVYPESIYQTLKLFYQRYSLDKIIITENGAAFDDAWHNGKIDDSQRQLYLKQYIAQCLRAKQEGVPLAGYFVWTLTDNFEWAEGYKPPFGLVHVDLTTQKRTIKESGQWYGRFIRKVQ